MQVEPRSVRARVILATVAGKSGRIPQAISLLHEAMGIEPSNRVVLDRLASLFRHVGRLKDAIQISEEAIYHHPEDPVGYLNLGRCRLAAHELSGAQECFEKAVSLAPENGSYHHFLADSLYLQGRNLDALREFRAAVDADPNLAPSWIRLAKLLVHHGDREGAIGACKRALVVDPNLAEGHVVWAEALQELGDAEGADEHLRLAASADPKGAVAHGFRLQVLGRFADARLAFERALETNPLLPRAYYGLVTSRRLTEEDRSLVERMRAAVVDPRLAPGDRVVLHFALGKAYEDLGDFGAAMRHFHEGNGTAALHMRLGFDAKHLASVNDERIKRFSHAYLQELAKHGSASETPLFVVGMIRSGTTLVEQALSNHPDIAGGGELRYWYEKEPEFAKGDPPVREMAETYLELLTQLGGGKARVIDKMPLNFAFLGMMYAAFPRARFIHCARSPIDNCLSIYTTFFDNPPPFSHVPSNIIAYYRQYERMMAHWRRVIPKDRILEVRYEDMVADRDRVTREMVRFSGLDWSDAVLRHEDNPRAVRTPSLWQVRQPIYTSSVERWRRYEPWLSEFAELIPK